MHTCFWRAARSVDLPVRTGLFVALCYSPDFACAEATMMPDEKELINKPFSALPSSRRRRPKVTKLVADLNAELERRAGKVNEVYGDGNAH